MSWLSFSGEERERLRNLDLWFGKPEQWAPTLAATWRASLDVFRRKSKSINAFFVLSLVAGFAPALNILAMKRFLNALSAARPEIADAQKWLIVLCGVLILQSLISPLKSWLSNLLLRDSEQLLSGRLLHALDALAGIELFDMAATSDRLKWISYATRGLHNLLWSFPFVITSFIIITTLPFAVREVPIALFLAVTLSFVPYALFYCNFRNLATNFLQIQSSEARYLDYVKYTALDRGFAKEMQLGALGQFFLKKYDDTFVWAISFLWKVRRVRFLWIIGSGLVTIAGLLLFHVFLYHRLIQHSLSIGSAVSASLAVFTMGASVVGGVDGIGGVFFNCKYFVDYYYFIDQAREQVTTHETQSGSEETARGEDAGTVSKALPIIEFRNVSFRYPDSQDQILEDLCFQIEAGEKVAIIGPNGCGKSTVIKLIAGLYRPVQGSILIDGKPLGEDDLDSWRQRIAVVFQDFTHYPMSAQENIAMGAATGAEDADRVRQAAEKAGISSRLLQLPDGYAAHLTRELQETGVELSGGEWQKIALARMFFRDADVVILDEPTAGLDMDGEYNLIQEFAHMVADKTAIIVSHRLSMAHLVDKVIVIDRGHVVEVGAHDDLIRSDGLYRRLYTAQRDLYYR